MASRSNAANSHIPQSQVSHLARVMTSTARRMAAGFDELREAFDHSTLKGNGGEGIVAAFLSERLPGQVGVTTGQVIDSNGAMSKQADVVLYDTIRTPMLFTSPSGETLVPVEGVIAVVEVKTRLTRTLLPSILDNCLSVKRLSRVAYLDASPQWRPDPIYYSVFAAAADNLYADPLNELQGQLPPRDRIDSVGYLGRGVNLNLSMDGQTADAVYSALPDAASALADIESEHGLLLWYGTIATAAARSQRRPIDILQYMRSETSVAGRLKGAALDVILARILHGLTGDSCPEVVKVPAA